MVQTDCRTNIAPRNFRTDRIVELETRVRCEQYVIAEIGVAKSYERPTVLNGEVVENCQSRIKSSGRGR